MRFWPEITAVPIDAEEEVRFRHLGGGRKGILLLLRYVYILAAAYLLIYQVPTLPASHGAMIAVALASNVGLSFMPEVVLFSWYVEAPVLITDTLWVAWALHSTAAGGQALFLLYFFVLFVAVVGENILLVVLGSTVLSATEVYLTARAPLLTSASLLHITFFYTVALFFGYVLSQIKRERQRADKGFAWAKELEAKVAERTVELSRLYEEVLVTSRLKSEFLATISHELRTPLHIILGYAEMLKEKDARAVAVASDVVVDRIVKAATEQLHLVNNVLDLGRADSGKMSVDKQWLDLDRFMAELEGRERMPLAAGLVLHWRVPANLPAINTDPKKLAVVLDNLVDNAIKFTTAGSITLSVREGPQQQQRRVEFVVEDTGPGIAAADLPLIFEIFRQVDGSVTRRHGGVGLGLAIVDRYVQLLGGTVAVDSRVGRGSRFIVSLPYQPEAEPCGPPETGRGDVVGTRVPRGSGEAARPENPI